MWQLGVLDNPNHKITALLYHLAMITVQSDSHGCFDCKPLGLLWAQFPEVRTTVNIHFVILLLQIWTFKCFSPPPQNTSAVL